VNFVICSPWRDHKTPVTVVQPHWMPDSETAVRVVQVQSKEIYVFHVHHPILRMLLGWNKIVCVPLFYSHPVSFIIYSHSLQSCFIYLYCISQGMFADILCPFKFLLADIQFGFLLDFSGQLTPIFATIFVSLFRGWEAPNLAGLPQNWFLHTSSIY
jgi:hypothetical protein